MRAIVVPRFGSPDVLTPADVADVTAAPDQVLIRVKATGINPIDVHTMRGESDPMRSSGLGLRQPHLPAILGSDVAGTVVSVGTTVKRFRYGDEVYALPGMGGLGELVAVSDKVVAPKPANTNFVEAASVPLAGMTALQGLRDVARVQMGDHVLINGAGGGVGTFAVQLAKVLGAKEVIGVCSAKNIDLVCDLGADDAMDYMTTDFTRGSKLYDLVVDLVGNHPTRDLTKALKPRGAVLSVVGSVGGKLFGFAQMAGAKVSDRFIRQQVLTMVTRPNVEDLMFLKDLIENGEIKPIVGRKYPLERAGDAFRYLANGHAVGKVVIEH